MSIEEEYKERIQQAKQLLAHSKYDEVLKTIELYEKNENLTKIQQWEIQLLQGEVHYRKGSYNDALAIANKVFKESQSHQNLFINIDAQNKKLEVLFRLGSETNEITRLIEAIEGSMKKLEPADPVEVMKRKAPFLRSKALLHELKEEFRSAMDLYQESLRLYEI